MFPHARMGGFLSFFISCLADKKTRSGRNSEPASVSRSSTMQRQQPEGEAGQGESGHSSGLVSLPREVLSVVVKLMDSQSRRTWRLVDRACCTAVEEATSRLSFHTQDEDTMSTVPSGLLAKCQGLKQLSCSCRSLSFIQGLPAALELLDVYRASLTDLSPLGHCTALRQLRLVSALSAAQRGQPQHLPSVLVQLTALRSLDLSSNALEEQQTRALAPALGSLTTLQRLVLSGNRTMGVDALAPAIQQLTNLQQLILSDVGSGSAAVLAPALRALSQLKQLDLSMGGIAGMDVHRVEGAAALAPAIRHLSQLLQLRLSSSYIQGACMVSLAPALQQLTGLQQLDLGTNSLGPGGAVVLAPALRQLPGLKTLDLSANNLRKEGALVLAAAIQDMLGLQRLYLRNNGVGPEGSMAIAAAVHHLPKIQLLDLQGSDLVTSADVEGVTLFFRSHSPSCRLYLS